MSDYIKRDKAIEYFMINTNWHDEDGYSIDDWDEKRKLLEDYFNGVPSEDVQPVRWIPCSERLPKIEEAGTSRMVLLCWTDGQVTVGAYAGDRTFVGQAWPKAKGASVRVIAWMPLPEPYQEGADE